MNFCSGPSDHRYFQNHFTPSSLMPPEFSNEFSIRSLSPTTTPSLTSSYPMTALLHRRLLSILERAQRSGKILNNHYYISLFILRLVERKPLIKIYFYPMTALYQTIDKNLFQIDIAFHKPQIFTYQSQNETINASTLSLFSANLSQNGTFITPPVSKWEPLTASPVSFWELFKCHQSQNGNNRLSPVSF